MTSVQSVAFSRAVWDTDNARRWLDRHGFERKKKVDITKNELRYRLIDPYPEAVFASKHLAGIRGVRFTLIRDDS